MDLTAFRTLGRSGLIVSPLCLGTMTFGASRWGSSDEVSAAVFEAYVEAGGNFIDTADVYAGGRSEETIGSLLADRTALRDRLVLATKFAWHTGAAGDPNGGGNGRKHIHKALETSLRRLRTDHVDLYWLHAWDGVTPAEEVLQTFGTLIEAGKIRYFGLSNIPAWYAVRMATLAAVHGVPGPIALQLEYSLVQRGIEREFVPAARACGLGLCPWSPLAGGFLTGKYRRGDERADPASRLGGANPFGDTKFSAANWDRLDALRTIAAELGRPPAEVALAWAAQRPSVSSLIIGASKPEQLRSNMGALATPLPAEQMARLDEASAPEAAYPYPIFEPAINRMIFGGRTVAPWS